MTFSLVVLASSALVALCWSLSLFFSQCLWCGHCSYVPIPKGIGLHPSQPRYRFGSTWHKAGRHAKPALVHVPKPTGNGTCTKTDSEWYKNMYQNRHGTCTAHRECRYMLYLRETTMVHVQEIRNVSHNSPQTPTVVHVPKFTK